MIMETVKIWHVKEEEGGAEMLHLNQKFQGVGHHHEVSSLDLSSHEMTTWRTHKLCSTLFLENRNNVSTGILPLTQASFLNNNPVVAQPTFSNFLNFHFLFSFTAASFEYSACDILQKTGLSILVRHRWQTDFNIWVLHGTLGVKSSPFFTLGQISTFYPEIAKNLMFEKC